MNINFTARTIELSAAEMVEAKKFGSELNQTVMNLIRDTGYSVVEMKAKRTKSDGITKRMIEDYVKEHGTSEQKQTYLLLTNPYDADGNYLGTGSFLEVKRWFLGEFRDFDKSRKDRDAQIREINEAIEKKIAEAKKAEAKKRYEEYKAAAEAFAA